MLQRTRDHIWADTLARSHLEAGLEEGWKSSSINGTKPPTPSQLAFWTLYVSRLEHLSADFALLEEVAWRGAHPGGARSLRVEVGRHRKNAARWGVENDLWAAALASSQSGWAAGHSDLPQGKAIACQRFFDAIRHYFALECDSLVNLMAEQIASLPTTEAAGDAKSFRHTQNLFWRGGGGAVKGPRTTDVFQLYADDGQDLHIDLVIVSGDTTTAKASAYKGWVPLMDARVMAYDSAGVQGYAVHLQNGTESLLVPLVSPHQRQVALPAQIKGPKDAEAWILALHHMSCQIELVEILP